MKKFVIIAAIAALIASYFLFDLGQYLTFDAIKEQVANAQQTYAENPVLVIAIFFAIYVIATAASFPGAALLTLAAGGFSASLLAQSSCHSPRPLVQRWPSSPRALCFAIHSKRSLVTA